MTEDVSTQQALEIRRVFEQPADTPSLYSDFAQVMGTGHEVILQFYETVPGPPGAAGRIEVVRSRLRATVVVSRAHAGNIGRLLLQHAEGPQAQIEGEEGAE